MERLGVGSAMRKNRMAWGICIFYLWSCLLYSAVGLSDADLKREIAARAQVILSQVQEPTIGSVGGEWAVLGLSRGEISKTETFFKKYYENVEKNIKQTGGVLSQTKYTEYSRLIIALSALEKDVTNVGGYNLLEKLADMENVVRQGINGPIFALIAFDTKTYEIPVLVSAKKQVTRQLLIEEIIGREIVTAAGVRGGFALSGNTPDPDVTAMALQALAPYKNQREVALVIDRGIYALQRIQLENGGFSTVSTGGIESAAQVIVALCALKIDPRTDDKFIKTDSTGTKNSPVSYICAAYEKEADTGEPSLMTTEQSLYALVALERYSAGKSPLYTMEADRQGTAFTDIQGHWAKESITKNNGFGITNQQGGAFEPDKAITRGEFAVALVRAFDLKEGASLPVFTDISKTMWYQAEIGIAASLEIVRGRGSGIFDPQGEISRQEAMAMIQRTAQHFGANTAMTPSDMHTLLARFPDGEEVDWWAMGPAGYNLKEGIIVGKSGKIAPYDSITRAETVVIIERLLGRLNKQNQYQG